MKKIALLIDSTFIISETYLKQNNIFVIPLSVNFSNVTFIENKSEESLLDDVFKKIKEDKKIPKTSQPSTEEYLQMYQKIKDAGYDEVIGLYISSNLSGTYQGAINAQKIFEEENPEFKIRNFDSLNVVLSIFALKDIVNHLNENEEITDEYILNKLKFYEENAMILLSVDTLQYLALGGRISPSIAALGNLFDIKPLLKIESGKILEHSKVRSSKKAFKKMLEVFEEDVRNNKNKTFYIGVAHLMDKKMAEKLESQMKKILKSNKVKYEEGFYGELGSVIAVHVGPKTVGIGWSIKDV